MGSSIGHNSVPVAAGVRRRRRNAALQKSGEPPPPGSGHVTAIQIKTAHKRRTPKTGCNELLESTVYDINLRAQAARCLSDLTKRGHSQELERDRCLSRPRYPACAALGESPGIAGGPAALQGIAPDLSDSIFPCGFQDWLQYCFRLDETGRPPGTASAFDGAGDCGRRAPPPGFQKSSPPPDGS